jgi:ABC-type glycerol-3-phosphate transport system permease component
MEYLWGWGVWLLATLVVLALGFRLSRAWRPLWLRDLVRILAVTTLMVPAEAGLAGDYYAPAYIVLVFEAFLQPEGDPAFALTALTLAWGLGLAVLAGRVLWRRRSRPVPPASDGR